MLSSTPFFYVYTLKCNDSTWYTGCTRDLNQRFKRHQDGRVKSTSKRLPVEIVSCTVFKDKYKAFYFEKYLKTGSGRAFLKKHLI
ncbi:MAG: GIY-YIG nuclease family protein [Arcticibacter sp.]